MLPKSRKRVTASARARVSLTKARKVVNKGSDGSCLVDKETVSNWPTITEPSTSSADSDAIMTMLYEIKESNADLARRLGKVQRHNSTPLNPWSHSLGQSASPQLSPSKVPYHTDIASQLRDPITMPDMGQTHLQPHPSLIHQGQTTRGTQCQNSNIDPLPRTQEQPGYSMDHIDAIIPNLQTLRNTLASPKQ